MKCFLSLLVGLIVFCLMNATRAQDSLNVETVDRLYENDSYSVGLAVQDTVVYVATSMAGLQVYSVADASNPVKIASLNLPGKIHNIDLQNDIAYITCAYEGVAIVDVSDPYFPQLLTLFEHETLYNCAVQDSLLFCAAGWDGVLIRDISDPTNPAYVSVVPVDEFCYRISVEGEYVYVAGLGYDLMHIVDISEPSSPQIRGSLTATNSFYDIEVQGDYAYLSELGDGLMVANISDPDNPLAVGWVADYYAASIEVEGDVGYLACSSDGLIILDLSNPAVPVIAGEYLPEEYLSVRHVQYHDGIAFTASSYNILATFDASDPQAITELYRSERGFYPAELEKMGDKLIVSGAGGENRVLDLADPVHPTEMSSFETIGSAIGFAHDERYLYGSYYYDLMVIDMEDPFNPIVSDTVDLEGFQCVDLDVQDTLLVTAGESDYSLGFFDISDPMHPEPILTFYAAEWPRNAQIEGNLLYVFTPRGMIIYDISDLDEITMLGDYYNRNVQFYEGVVKDNVAYQIDWTNEHVWTFDVTDPTDIRFLTYFRNLDAFGLAVSVEGPYVYIAGDTDGLRILDVSDPTSISMAGSYSPLASTRDVLVYGNYIYAANFTDLSIYDATQAQAVNNNLTTAKRKDFRISHVYPNPFNSSTTITLDIPQSQHIEVKVFDLLGRLVAVLYSDIMDTGNHRLLWEGESLHGQTAPSGTYIVKAISNEVMKSNKIIYIK